MDILDIILAKSLTPQGQIDTYAAKAQKAVVDAKKAVDDIESITEQTNLNNENAQAALENAQAAAQEFESINDEIDSKIANIEAVEEVTVEDNNASTYKSKTAKVRKKGILNSFNLMKNYISTGSNDDGSMTQKAITNALNAQKTELENKIKNIPAGGGASTSGITTEDEGSILAVDENGNITPSTISEADIVLTQIISGTYQHDNIVGLEIDYENKTYTRLQGAKNLNPGTDFDKFVMYGGRKRCIVDASGNIIKFIDESTEKTELEGQRVMVYQPAFYYLRIPITTTNISNGIKINKEHIYISDTDYAGFKLHPMFIDENNKPLKFVLLPAFESAAKRFSNNELVTDDAQDLDLENDKLISTIDIKPISGYSQNFNYLAAKRMCQNNGRGWDMTDLKYESINQMLMIIEFGTMNIQDAFNIGIVNISNTAYNNACITGSTFDLYNASGRATFTINNINGVDSTSTTNGYCAISYRGVENPYGGIWRFINNVKIEDSYLVIDDVNTLYKLSNVDGWIDAMGYYKNIDWAYLPISTGNNANSNLPVGDYVFCSNNSYLLIGGSYAAERNAGPFYYHYNSNTNDTHFYNDSARIMYKPIANSAIETNSYNLWKNS